MVLGESDSTLLPYVSYGHVAASQNTGHRRCSHLISLESRMINYLVRTFLCNLLLHVSAC